MLYDAAFDVPMLRGYLKYFDAYVMNNESIESKDRYLALFNECMDYLRCILDKNTFKTFKKYIKIEHVSQVMSIYQSSDKPTSKDELMKITFSKGGISGLILMYIMAPQMKKQELKAIYELGAVLQLIDDINDMDEDLRVGIQTLPNQKLLSYQKLKQLYNGVVNNLIDKCGINSNEPNATLNMLCWFGKIMLEKKYAHFVDDE